MVQDPQSVNKMNVAWDSVELMICVPSLPLYLLVVKKSKKNQQQKKKKKKSEKLFRTRTTSLWFCNSLTFIIIIYKWGPFTTLRQHTSSNDLG